MIKKLSIKSFKNLFLDTIGNHLSKFSGSGIDFKDLREYSGDDIRYINWRVTARVNKPIINEYYDSRQLNLVVVFLVSGSLYFGSVKQKITTAREIFNILNQIGVYNKDKTKALIATNFIKEYNLNQKNIQKILNLEIGCLNKIVDFKQINDYLLKIKQKSVVFLIGDFLDFYDLRLLSKKHELNVIIVRDRFEEEPKLVGEFNLIDGANFDEVELFLDDELLNEYKLAFQESDKKLFNHLFEYNIKYKKIYTSDNSLIKLREFLC